MKFFGLVILTAATNAIRVAPTQPLADVIPHTPIGFINPFGFKNPVATTNVPLNGLNTVPRLGPFISNTGIPKVGFQTLDKPNSLQSSRRFSDANAMIPAHVDEAIRYDVKGTGNNDISQGGTYGLVKGSQ